MHLITPSKWSKEGFLRTGLPESRITVLPHGFNASVFYPARNAAARNALREAQGWDDGCVVILSVGHMRWVKGADSLLFGVLSAVLQAAPGSPCVRLVLKGQDSLYGASRELAKVLDTMEVERVKNGVASKVKLREEYEELAAQGKLYMDILGEELSHSELGDLMRGADLYVSPYRAEGFNLPVLEAAASGLPLVVTLGGATDEFTDASFTKYVKAAKVVGGHDNKSPLSIHLEPDTDALTKAIVEAVRDKEWRRRAAKSAATWVKNMPLTWTDVARNHVDLL